MAGFSISRAYHLADLARLTVLPFSQRAQIPGPSGFNTLPIPAPNLVYRFTHFAILPFNHFIAMAIFTILPSGPISGLVGFYIFCTGPAGLSVYHFPIWPFYRLTVSLFYHSYRFPALSVFNIFAILRAPYRFAYFTILPILSLVSFIILPCASVFGPVGFSILPFCLRPYLF